MAVSNRSLAKWTLSRLSLKPDDQVLEVGFGPGVALQLASKKLKQGVVAGVDPSEEMVIQAEKNNRRGLQQGRVLLNRGNVENLPFPTARFTKVFSINGVYIWKDIQRGLREIRRVLKSNGKVALTIQPHSTTNKKEIISLHRDLENLVRQADFLIVSSEIKKMRPTNAFFVLGKKY